jgi:hypothetical protein
LSLGYGMDHRLARRWSLGWNLQGRYVWVFIDTQRQIRASLRPTVVLRDRHRLALELVGFLVHRDEDQFGELDDPADRLTVNGQVAFEHTWMSRKGVGTFAALRYATSFMSGQAPMYEVREEAINTHYGELSVGFRAVW